MSSNRLCLAKVRSSRFGVSETRRSSPELRGSEQTTEKGAANWDGKCDRTIVNPVGIGYRRASVTRELRSVEDRYSSSSCRCLYKAGWMGSRNRVHGGWLIAALVAGSLCVLIVFGFRTGSCQDSLNPAASNCTQGAEPFAILFGLAGASFVIVALIRSFQRQ